MARYYTDDGLWRATDKLTGYCDRYGNVTTAELIQLDYHGAIGSWTESWTWCGDYRTITEAARWVNPDRFQIPDDEKRDKWRRKGKK